MLQQPYEVKDVFSILWTRKFISRNLYTLHALDHQHHATTLLCAPIKLGHCFAEEDVNWGTWALRLHFQG